MNASVQLVFFFLFSWEPSPGDGATECQGEPSFLSLPNLDVPSQACPRASVSKETLDPVKWTTGGSGRLQDT